MNLAWFDWLIVLILFVIMIGLVFATKKLMRSVADFLAAGRTGGRYLLSVSQGAAGLGAITIVGMLEMDYIAGFTLSWWAFINAIIIMIMTVSGWILYRFRKTRALTMAQFFEMRYSRKFRIFAGIIAYISGIVNFGIFPAVSARFFIYFCGLPEYVTLLGIPISTFLITLFAVIAIPLFFVFVGGQIAVMITDFFQGVFVNIVLVIIVILFLFQFNWSQILDAVSQAPVNASLINPFKTGNLKDYNFWYFFIGALGLIYVKLSWQGTQAYNVSAKSAHEAKMGDVLSNWRNIPQWSLFLVFVPIVAYTFMHHNDFISQKSSIEPILNGLNSDALKSQLTVPLVLSKLLPFGLMGAFAAVMLAASIACHETYLHSWGSIFVQDVIMSFRKEPFTPEKHIKYLKLSILFVAVFIFFFSLLFQQSEYIFLFFAITGAIFTGGSGAVIIGGLYWKRGTTAAAWSAMITGSIIAVGGIAIQQIIPNFFINGQTFWGLAMASSSIVFIVVSLFGKHKAVDMDKILHQGKYEIKDEVKIINEEPVKGWKVLGVGKEFTKGDKIIYIITYIWTFSWVGVFIIGTIFNLTYDVSDSTWLEFWKIYTWILLIVSIIVIFWFTTGGIIDLKEMLKRLKLLKRDHTDSGFVIRQNKRDEETSDIPVEEN